MKRREFLWASSALSGLIVPVTARSQVKPCPPSQLSVQGGSSSSALCASGDAESDWIARSTSPGVIWAHDFRYAGELDRHLAGNKDRPKSGVWPRRAQDGPTGNSLEFIALGAQLTEDFGTSATQLRINDTTYWPDGDFYFHLCKQTKDQQNNLFYCRSRNGNILDVEYVPVAGQPFAASRRPWLVGDVTGHECCVTWARNFSALTAGDNGLPVDDRAEGVALRSKTKGNSHYVPHYSTFGYGWYGRPEYQSKYAAWTPTYDSIPRTKVWDGDEFYIQFRLKIDKRFWQYHYVDPNGEDNRWSHKIWMLQSEESTPQQITAVISPSNRYEIPSTRPSPFYLSAYDFNGGLAGRRLTNDISEVAGVSSFQPGSPWEATANTGSFKPAGSAWEYYDDEWLTFLLHVKPGLDWMHGDNTTARNTVLEVLVARQGGPYTTLYSVNNQAIIFGDRVGEHIFGTALPGYNSFIPTGYLNVELGNVPPIRSYYRRFTQVIFSKKLIAPPAV